eukprot:XP_001703027.1 predicted protein [Chlamydomonas reinhardtii]
MRELASMPFDSLVSAVAPMELADPYALRARGPPPAAPLRDRTSCSGLGPGTPHHAPLPNAAAASQHEDHQHARSPQIRHQDNGDGGRAHRGPGQGRSLSATTDTHDRFAAPVPAAAMAAAAAPVAEGLLSQHMRLRREGSLLSALAGADALQQLVAELEAAGAGLGGLLVPRVLLRRSASVGRQRPSSHAGDTAGGWPTGDLGGGTHHAAPPSSRPRVVVDEDGWQVPPPELLRQAPGAAARERDELGAGGRWPQRRSASTGRHPRLGRNRGGGISGGEDDWPFSAGGVGGMGMGGLFHMPLMPLGALRDMLGGLGGLEMGLLGLEPVLLPHGLSAADGASGGMGLRPHNASGRYPSGTAGNGGDGYEALVALDEGRVKRVVRPEVVRALPTRTARRTDTSQQCGVCLERYVEGGSSITTLPCGHAFSTGCAEPWLGGQSATCPTCRWAFPQHQTQLLMEPQ